MTAIEAAIGTEVELGSGGKRVAAPTRAADSGFEALVRSLAVDIAGRFGGDVSVDAGCGASVSSELRGMLLLVVSEAMTNAFHHGRARRVSVCFDAREGFVRVVDDGRGFNPMMRAPGRGLVRMREQAATLGASLCVRSFGRGGTTVEVRFTG